MQVISTTEYGEARLGKLKVRISNPGIELGFWVSLFPVPSFLISLLFICVEAWYKQEEDD